MKILRFIQTIVCIALIFTGLVSTDAQAQTRQLSMPSIEANTGDIVRVSVLIDDAQDIASVRIGIAMKDDLPYTYVPDSFTTEESFTADWNPMTVNPNLPDMIIASNGGPSLSSGTGALLYFSIRIKDDANNVRAPLAFQIDYSGQKLTRLNDGAIPVILESGEVVIGNAPPIPTPTPVPVPDIPDIAIELAEPGYQVLSAGSIKSRLLLPKGQGPLINGKGEVFIACSEENTGPNARIVRIVKSSEGQPPEDFVYFNDLTESREIVSYFWAAENKMGVIFGPPLGESVPTNPEYKIVFFTGPFDAVLVRPWSLY